MTGMRFAEEYSDLEVIYSRPLASKQDPKSYNPSTLSYHILHRFALLLREDPCGLFSQFWQYQGSNRGEDSRENRIPSIEQPS